MRIFLYLQVLIIFWLPSSLRSQDQPNSLESEEADTLSSQSWAIALAAGTQGFSGDIVTSLNPLLNLRLTAGGADFNYTGQQLFDGVLIGYNAELRSRSAGLLLDYHPWSSRWRLSAGLYWHQPTLNVFAEPLENFQYGSSSLRPDQLGSLEVDLNYAQSWMPYLGVGYGNAILEGSRLKGFVSLGFLYSQAPQISMQGKGLIAPTAEQSEDLQEGFDEFPWFPQLQLGFSYRLSR